MLLLIEMEKGLKLNLYFLYTLEYVVKQMFAFR